MMQYKSFSSILALLLFCFVTGCYHQNPLIAKSDCIKSSFIFSKGGVAYLFLEEEIFQATLKSVGTSGTYNAGYNDYRYSVRTLRQGRLVRSSLQQQATGLIGFDGHLVWFLDEQLGLLARDPLSFEVIITQNELVARNKSLRSLAKVKVEQRFDLYRIDPLNQCLRIRLSSGDCYLVDPLSYRVKMVETPLPVHYSKITNESWDFETSNGNQISWKELKKKMLAFPDLKILNLEGGVILENSVTRLGLIAKEAVLRNNCISTNSGDLAFQNHSAIALGHSSHLLYLTYPSSVLDNAGTVFAQIDIDGEPKIKWITILPDIFFQPQQALASKANSGLFSAGNPDYSYQWYGIEAGVLCGVKMLYGFGIDLTNGRLLWKQKL